MWYFSAPNGHRSVLFSAISVCDWAMDPGGESCPEWHIPEAHSCPLVVLWCWSRRGVRHLPDCGGAVRSDWVRVYKNVLFACCHSVAPVWKQKKNQTTLLMWTLFFNMFHVYKYRFVKCLEPEQSFGLKRPQHKWSLHCFLTFSFIRQWNKKTKNPETEEQRHTHPSSCLVKCFVLHFYQSFVLFPSSTLIYYLSPNSLKCQLLHMRITSQKRKPHSYMSF